jgi:plastocyanin
MRPLFLRLANLSLFGFVAVTCLTVPAIMQAQTNTPGNCSASYPNAGGGFPFGYDAVLANSGKDSSGNSIFLFQDIDGTSAVTQNTTTEVFSPSTNFIEDNVNGGHQTHAIHDICVGDTIGWSEPSSQSGADHTSWSGNCPGDGVCSQSAGWVLPPGGGLMSVGPIYTNTFNTAGVYTYFCGAHLAAMQGYVNVNPFATNVALSGGTSGPYGTLSNFTATISSSPSRGGSPNSGTATFKNGSTTIGTATVSSGTATLSGILLPPGANQITASYGGDGNKYGASGASNTVTVTITAASTSTTLVSSLNPAPPGQNVTFTATVTNTSTSVAPSAADTVTVNDNGSPIGTAAFQSASANAATYAFSASSLAPGSHPITAVFTSSSFNTSTSNTVNEVIQDFQINITNPIGSVLPLQTFTYNGTLTSVGGYSGSVAISCVAGSTATPSTCASAGSPFTVTSGGTTNFTVSASNNVAAPTFNFNIQAQDSVANITHIFPVTLNVGASKFNAMSCGVATSQCAPPRTVSVAPGNPSVPLQFSVQSQGTFTGQVVLTCPSIPAGLSCRFANGAATQTVELSEGETVADTLTIDAAGSAALNTYSVTVKAVPNGMTAQAQTQTVTVNVVAGTATVNVTAGLGAPITDPAAVGHYKIPLKVTNTLTTSAPNVTMLVTFDQPVGGLSTSAPGACTVDNAQHTVSCALGTSTSPLAGSSSKTVFITVEPLVSSRTLTIVNQVLCTPDANAGNPNTVLHLANVRLRPWVHNGIPAKKP